MYLLGMQAERKLWVHTTMQSYAELSTYPVTSLFSFKTVPENSDDGDWLRIFLVRKQNGRCDDAQCDAVLEWGDGTPFEFAKFANTTTIAVSSTDDELFSVNRLGTRIEDEDWWEHGVVSIKLN